MNELLIELINKFPNKNIIYGKDEIAIIDQRNKSYKKVKESDLDGLTIQEKLDKIVKKS